MTFQGARPERALWCGSQQTLSAPRSLMRTHKLEEQPVITPCLSASRWSCAMSPHLISATRTSAKLPGPGFKCCLRLLPAVLSHSSQDFPVMMEEYSTPRAAGEMATGRGREGGPGCFWVPGVKINTWANGKPRKSPQRREVTLPPVTFRQTEEEIINSLLRIRARREIAAEVINTAHSQLPGSKSVSTLWSLTFEDGSTIVESKSGHLLHRAQNSVLVCSVCLFVCFWGRILLCSPDWMHTQ